MGRAVCARVSHGTSPADAAAQAPCGIVDAWPSAAVPMSRRVADGRRSAAARDTSNA
jgi:hypothetical protein